MAGSLAPVMDFCKGQMFTFSVYILDCLLDGSDDDWCVSPLFFVCVFTGVWCVGMPRGGFWVEC